MIKNAAHGRESHLKNKAENLLGETERGEEPTFIESLHEPGSVLLALLWFVMLWSLTTSLTISHINSYIVDILCTCEMENVQTEQVLL